MHKLHRLLTLFASGLFFFLGGVTASAAENPFWDFSIYGTSDPKQLYQKSVDSESRAEKIRIRSYVAAKIPNTPEGLHSRAWVSYYEGKAEEEGRLLGECVQRYPKLIYCLSAYLADHPEDLALSQRYLDLEPEYYNYGPVRHMFELLGKQGKKSEQKAFAASMKQRFAGKWIATYLDVLEVKERGDRVAERAALRRTIAAPGTKPPFFVYEELIALEIGYFFQGNEDRMSLAARLVGKYLNDTNRFDEYAPWKYLIGEFPDHRQALLKLFVQNYDQLPGGTGKYRPIPAEALDSVVNRGSAVTDPVLGPWLKKLRERFAARRASEPLVDKILLWFETGTDSPLPTVIPKWERLVNDALTEKDAVDAAYTALSVFLQHRADCASAQRLSLGWNQRFANSVAYHRNAVEASLCANDLAQARQHVDATTRLESKPNATDRSDRMRVAFAEAQAKAWNEQQAKNPFIKRWDQKDGGRVALNIEFASNSATIPPRYAEPLNQLARLLKDNGAEDYQFDIGGHTDSRGSAALNQKLSEQRALAIVDYLVAKTGIERARLSHSGHGSAVPVASNATDAGMQQNRRVEISPRANLRTPTLVQEASFDWAEALSPDGRILAGSNALWDVKTRLKLRDLPATPLLYQMTFLPDGRHLLRLIEMKWPSKAEKALELLDVASGLVVRRLVLDYDVGGGRGFSVSPDGRRLAMVNVGHVQVFSLPSLELRGQRMISMLAARGQIAWVGNDRLAAAAVSPDEKMMLLHADTLATVKTFDELDHIQTIGVTRSGKSLVAIPNRGGALHVWDTQNWQHKSMPLGAFADNFASHPFEEKIIINQWNGTDLRSRLIDLGAMKVVKVFDNNFSGVFTPDGKRFFYHSKEYDSATLESKPWEPAKTASESSYLRAWLPDTGQFVTESGKDSQIWDVGSGRQVDRIANLNLCGAVDGSPTLFWKCGTEGAVMVERGSWREIPNPSVFKPSQTQSVYARTATRQVVFERDPAPSKGRVAKRGKLSIVDSASGKILVTHPILLRLEDALYASDDALHEGGISTAIDPTGRYLALRVYWKEHWGYPALSGKQVWLFDLESGKEIDKVSLNPRAEKIAFAPGNTPLLRVGFENYTGVYELASKKWGKDEPWAAKESLLAENESLKVVSLNEKLTLLDSRGSERYIFLRKSPNEVALFLTQNLMMVYYGGGEFDYYDLKTLSRQLTLHAKGKGEWLAYAPGGEFSATANGADGYYWALGDKYLPFSALRERFERPDVIARQLQNVVRGTASAPVVLAATSLRQDSASAAGMSPTTPQKPPTPQKPQVPPPGSVDATAPTVEADLFMPPFSLRLIDPPAKSREPKLSVKVGITRLRAINLEPEVELNINGQQVKTRGLARMSGGKNCADNKNQVDCEQVMELPLNLDDGRNVVQVSLLYRNARLETKTAVIELDRPRQVGQAAPRLYLFAAGVSQYAESKQNLKHAHRDAEELAKTLKTQEGKLYSQVNVKVLTNQQVIKGTLDTEINRFLRQATEQDLIVILLAGHGVQDNDQTLYFMTHDANTEEPFSGLNVASIRNILRNRPPNQKAVLLLDICHAGALGEGKRGTVSAEDAIKQLSLGTGITVLSSSTGRELSNEGANFRGGHGAFTAAVLEGIEGAADKVAGNRDGVVSIAELMTYVMRRVPELTKNSQHPTSPSSERLQDFPMAVNNP